MAEMGPTWVKSSYSGSQGGNCVEAAAAPHGGILVRDTKNREGAVLGFRAVTWRRFADEIKSGHARMLAVPGFPELDRGRLSNEMTSPFSSPPTTPSPARPRLTPASPPPRRARAQTRIRARYSGSECALGHVR